jgi:shikimate dehydrogenase
VTGPTGATHVTAVIGCPVRHSLSPVMHNAAFRALGLDWVYVAFEVPPGSARSALAAMRALGIAGLNVTMPHKSDVAAAVDRLTPTAQALGAVNTVMRAPRGDELVGENTDGPGFIDALRIDEGFDPAGRRCVVIGAGGAARAVVRALADARAAEITVVNRTAARASAAASLAGAAGRVGVAADAAEADLIVNATPLGMATAAGSGGMATAAGSGGMATAAGSGDRALAPELPVDPATLGAGQLVVDLVYHPAVTPLVEAARARGAAAANGLGMLIHQAAHTIRLWTGEDPPLEVMSAAALGELSRRS